MKSEIVEGIALAIDQLRDAMEEPGCDVETKRALLVAANSALKAKACAMGIRPKAEA